MNIAIAQTSIVEGQRRTAPPEMGQVAVKRGKLYMLVEVSALSDEWDTASRAIVDLAVEQFVTSKAGETAALKEAAQAVNRYLLEQNESRAASDTILCGLNGTFIRDGEMFLVQAGPALTYIARGNSVTRFPKSIDSDQFAPLGDIDDAEVRLARFALQEEDVVAMTVSYLPKIVSEDDLNEAVQHKNADAVMAALTRLARGNDYSAMVLQYEPVNTTPPATVPRPASPLAKPSPPARPPQTVKPMFTPPPDPRKTEPPPRPAQIWDTPSEDLPVSPAASVFGQEKQEPPPPHRQTTAPLRSFSDPFAPADTERADQHKALEPADETPPAKPRREPKPRTKTPKATPPPEEVPPSRPSSRAKAAPPAPDAEPQTLQSRFAPRAPAEPEVITSYARAVEPPPPPKRERSRVRRDEPITSPVPMRGALPMTMSGDPALPSLHPLLRQLLALLLMALNGLMAGLLAFVRWLRDTFAPRVAASGGALDGVAAAFWRGVDEVRYQTNRILRQMLPGDRPAPHRNARPVAQPRGDGSDFLRTLVILVPLVVLLIAAGVWYFSDDADPAPPSAASDTSTAYSQQVGEAQALIAQARNVDPATAQTLISRALPLLDAATTTARTEEERSALATLRAEAQTLLTQAGVAGATASSTAISVVANPIVMFESTPPAELLFGGNALYMIEPTRNATFKILPAQPPISNLGQIAPLLEAQQRLATGVTVGTPAQITWVPSGGSRPNGGLLMLTREGQMFDYDPASGLLRQVSFAPVTGEMVATAGYGGNVYYLDKSNRQIWKYVPNATGEYSDAPSPWLSATGQAQLTDPLDMAIDGYIFVLESNGSLRRFQAGDATDFTLAPVTPPLAAPLALAKQPPEATNLFITDGQRIVSFDAQGKFLTEYRPAAGSDWGIIKDIAINEAGDTLYILSNRGVFWISLR